MRNNHNINKNQNFVFITPNFLCRPSLVKKMLTSLVTTRGRAMAAMTTKGSMVIIRRLVRWETAEVERKKGQINFRY